MWFAGPPWPTPRSRPSSSMTTAVVLVCPPSTPSTKRIPSRFGCILNCLPVPDSGGVGRLEELAAGITVLYSMPESDVRLLQRPAEEDFLAVADVRKVD